MDLTQSVSGCHFKVTFILNCHRQLCLFLQFTINHFNSPAVLTLKDHQSPDFYLCWVRVTSDQNRVTLQEVLWVDVSQELNIEWNGDLLSESLLHPSWTCVPVTGWIDYCSIINLLLFICTRSDSISLLLLFNELLTDLVFQMILGASWCCTKHKTQKKPQKYCHCAGEYVCVASACVYGFMRCELSQVRLSVLPWEPIFDYLTSTGGTS